MQRRTVTVVARIGALALVGCSSEPTASPSAAPVIGAAPSATLTAGASVTSPLPAISSTPSARALSPSVDRTIVLGCREPAPPASTATTAPLRQVTPPAALDVQPWDQSALEAKWIGAAARGAPETVTIDAHTTFAYGCSCPHFATAFGMTAFIYPKMGRGVPDALRWWTNGTFRLTGHYTGRTRTYLQWMSDRGTPVAKLEEGRDPSPYPEFEIEQWCYRPLDENPFIDVVRGEIDDMKRAGAPFCDGPMTKVPSPLAVPEVPPGARCSREKARFVNKGDPKIDRVWDRAWGGWDAPPPSRALRVQLRGEVDVTSLQLLAGATTVVEKSGVFRLEFSDEAAAEEGLHALLCDPCVFFAVFE